MAIIPGDAYPTNTAPADADYPLGKARNVSSAGADDGTPWEALLVNDLFGFLQGLLAGGGVTASGAPDTATASQYLEALRAVSADVAKGRLFDFELGGGFAAGDRCAAVRLGNVVTLTLYNAGNAQQNLADLGALDAAFADTLPAELHPSGTVVGLFPGTGSDVIRLSITSGGSLGLICRDASGALTGLNIVDCLSFSYTVASDVAADVSA